MSEPPQVPPADVLARARLLRLPLRPEALLRLQRRAAQRGERFGPLELAHELGDVRFAAAFAPAPAPQQRPRWQGALSVFSLLDGPSPALVGYSAHDIDVLRAVPLPPSWPDDPVVWEKAEEASLLPRLKRRLGLTVPFSAQFWPGYRVVDPAKPARGRRRVPSMREVDIARHIQASRPELERPAAYGTWLAVQLPGALLDPGDVRLAAEVTAPATVGSFRVISIRLTGRLLIEDPNAFGLGLLRGVGRRRAYGLGFAAVG